MTTSEQYPWPNAEDLDKDKTISDALRSEIRIYKSGEDFRRGIAAIAAIYDKTPFLSSMKNNARVMALSLSAEGHDNYSNGFDMDFYRGSVLGMHTILRLQSRLTRQAVLHQDTYANQKTENGTYSLTGDFIETMTTAMKEWRAGAYVTVYNDQEPETQQAIFDAAFHAYEDIEEGENNAQSFIAGFMMAKTQIFAISGSALELPSSCSYQGG